MKRTNNLRKQKSSSEINYQNESESTNQPTAPTTPTKIFFTSATPKEATPINSPAKETKEQSERNYIRDKSMSVSSLKYTGKTISSDSLASPRVSISFSTPIVQGAPGSESTENVRYDYSMYLD